MQTLLEDEWRRGILVKLQGGGRSNIFEIKLREILQVQTFCVDDGAFLLVFLTFLNEVLAVSHS